MPTRGKKRTKRELWRIKWPRGNTRSSSSSTVMTSSSAILGTGCTPRKWRFSSNSRMSWSWTTRAEKRAGKAFNISAGWHVLSPSPTLFLTPSSTRSAGRFITASSRKRKWWRMIWRTSWETVSKRMRRLPRKTGTSEARAHSWLALTIIYFSSSR